jgi:hypothetical protein
MLFGGLYELRIEIFTQRSLDTNKKAIRSLQRKTKSNQVLVSWPWRNLGEAFVSRLLAGAGETGSHGGARARRRRLARSAGRCQERGCGIQEHGRGRGWRLGARPRRASRSADAASWLRARRPSCSAGAASFLRARWPSCERLDAARSVGQPSPFPRQIPCWWRLCELCGGGQQGSRPLWWWSARELCGGGRQPLR